MNVPKLRFPEFKGEWKKTYLGKFLTFKNGINADKSSYGSGYKFINVLDIISDAPIVHDSIIGKVSISNKEFEKNKVIFGDILFQRSSETHKEAGQSNIYLDRQNNATFGGFVIRGRPIVELDPIFFNNLLKTDAARKDITSRSGGSTRFNIGQESLEAVIIQVCPTISEQKKIASFFKAIDTKISALRRKQDLLKEYKRGLMQKLFSRTLRFTDKNGQPFPDWQENRLGEVAKIQTGKTPSTHDPNLWHDELMFVTPTDIHDDIFFQEKTMRKITKTDAIQIVPKGSILYTCIASIGKISIAHYECATNQQINAILPKTSEVNNIFIYYSLVYQTPRIKRLSANTTLPIINKNDFSKIKISIPHPDEQQKIADALSSMDKKIDIVSDQIEKFEKFKKGLLQQMFV